MTPKMEHAVSLLRRCYAYAKNGPPGYEGFTDMTNTREEVLAQFQPMLSAEHLPKITEQEFRDFLPVKNNHHWNGLPRLGPAICADMTRLQEALTVLFDESQPIVDRLNHLSKDGPNYIPRLGRAVITPLLLVRYPDRYGVVNKVVEGSMRKLDIWPDFEPQTTFGEKYQCLNEIMVELASELDIDLWTLDGLWWAVVMFLEEKTGGSDGDDDDEIGPFDPMNARFGLERHLHDFLRDNWDHTELGNDWVILEQDGDPEAGYEYPTEIGPIDLLAKHRTESRWMVIELKRDQSSDKTVGQVLRYMGWVQEKLAKPEEIVQGLIIAHKADKRIRYALKNVRNVEVKLYEVSFQLNPMDAVRE